MNKRTYQQQKPTRSIQGKGQSNPYSSPMTSFQSIFSAPDKLQEDDVLHLQRTIGNQATQRLLLQRAALDSPEEALSGAGSGDREANGSLWTLIYNPNSRHFKVRFNRGLIPEDRKAMYQVTTRKDMFKRSVRKNRVITGAEWVDNKSCLLYVKKTSNARKSAAHNVEIWKFKTTTGNYIEPSKPEPLLSENRVSKDAAKTFMGGVDNLRTLNSIEEIANSVFDSVRGGEAQDHLLKYTSGGDPDAVRKVFAGEINEVACHALAMTFATVVNAIAAAAGVTGKATFTDKDSMVVTKPDLVTLGKGNVSNITQHKDKNGQDVANSTIAGHRILFTSHSWAIVNGKIYDLALGIRGGDTSGVDEDTFAGIDQADVKNGENANYTFTMNDDGAVGFGASWTVQNKN